MKPLRVVSLGVALGLFLSTCWGNVQDARGERDLWEERAQLSEFLEERSRQKVATLTRRCGSHQRTIAVQRHNIEVLLGLAAALRDLRRGEVPKPKEPEEVPRFEYPRFSIVSGSAPTEHP
jgi:hypothetical protein